MVGASFIAITFYAAVATDDATMPAQMHGLLLAIIMTWILASTAWVLSERNAKRIAAATAEAVREALADQPDQVAEAFELGRALARNGTNGAHAPTLLPLGRKRD